MTVSQKISFISFIAALCVIDWHCYCGSDIETWMIPLLFTWAVPWFFFVSGVFLVRSVERRSLIEFCSNKIRSLFVPYIFWCLWGAFIFFSDCRGFCDIFGLSISHIHPSGNGALWYLRALIVFQVVAVPILSIRIPCRIGVICGGGGVLFIIVIMVVNKYLFAVCTGSAPVYFAIGMLVSKYLLEKQDQYRTFDSLLTCLGAVLFFIGKSVYFAKGYDFNVTGGTIWANLSYVGMILFLLFGFNNIFRRVAKCNLAISVARLTAVVYFIHYPVLRRLIDFPFIREHINHNVLFVLLILIAPLFFFSVVYALHEKFPKVYGFLSGGR